MLDNKIAIIGECMIELQMHNQEIVTGFGGDTLNTAIYLSRLFRQSEHDYQVSYFTALGVDRFSNDMIYAWREEGVNIDHVCRYNDKLPGLYMIENRPCGERDFLYWRNDSAIREWLSREDTEQLFQQLKSFQVVYLSGITLAVFSPQQRDCFITLLAKLKEEGCLIAFDTNYRPNLWRDKQLAKQCYQQMYALTDIGLFTLEDEQLLFDDLSFEQTIERLAPYPMEQVIVKCGAQGCGLVHQGQVTWIATKEIETVVDTTAAGDSFNAGYLYQWLSTSDCIHAANIGHQLAGEVIQHKGAIIDLADMPEIEI